MNICYNAHFTDFGWTKERSTMDIAFLTDRRLKMLKVTGAGAECSVLCSGESKWRKPNKKGISGSVVSGKVLLALSIVSEEEYDIYYRLKMKKSGWTHFCANGDICGETDGDADNYIEGIQIFSKQKGEDVGEYLAKCDEKLDFYEKIKKQLFVQNPEKVLLSCTKNYFDDEAVGIAEVENGCILPLIKLDLQRRDGIFAGGVCDKDFNFVAGFDRKDGKRMNFASVEAYEVDKDKLVTNPNTVIFGGVYIDHFGHMIGECMSRLWYAIENSDDDTPIAILTVPEWENITYDFFELVGIDKNRIMLITEPTVFEKVIVPDQGVHLWSRYNEKYTVVYDKIRNSVTPAKYKKVFLTRTAFDLSASVNEECFDTIFANRGYEIIAPEKYSIKEQMEIMAGADEIACTEGTLSHLVLFAKPGTKLIILRRDYTCVLAPQHLVNQAKQADVWYVDATFNFLPTRHVSRCFLYGITEHLKKFLEAIGQPLSDDEISFDLRDHVYDYLKIWCENYNEIGSFNLISHIDAYDLLDRVNRVFGVETGSEADYVTKLDKLQAENKELKQEIKKLQEELSVQKNIIL